MIPGLGRSPGEGKGYPLQYSGLKNPMDYIVHGVTESDTNERLSLSLVLLFWLIVFLHEDRKLNLAMHNVMLVVDISFEIGAVSIPTISEV